MNRASSLKLLAVLPLASKLRLRAAPPRFAWICGPILTRVSSRFTIDPVTKIVTVSGFERVVYGQLIDREASSLGTVHCVNWAKLAPVDEAKAQDFLAKWTARWPKHAGHSNEFNAGILRAGEAYHKLS